jgi:dTDP-4-dehydrorhamnose 3,5-epimerase
MHQSDYWYVSHGQAQVVLHDLRQGSPTQGETQNFKLGTSNGSEQKGVYIPPGVAHGFVAITDITITYLVDNYYDPEDELGVAWNDPQIRADWEMDNPILSKRDQSNPLLENIEEHLQPKYQADS